LFLFLLFFLESNKSTKFIMKEETCFTDSTKMNVILINKNEPSIETDKNSTSLINISKHDKMINADNNIENNHSFKKEKEEEEKENGLNVESSLVDQILNKLNKNNNNKDTKTVNYSNDENEFSLLNLNLNGNNSSSHKILKNKNVELKIQKFNITNQSDAKNLNSNLNVIEMLLGQNGLIVPVDCFYHVLAHFKLTTPKLIFKHTLSNISNKDKQETTIISDNNGSNSYKCEIIYGDNFYWQIKIRRIYENLFQYKFVKNVNHSTGGNKSNNNSDISSSFSSSSNSNATSPCSMINNRTSIMSDDVILIGSDDFNDEGTKTTKKIDSKSSLLSKTFFFNLNESEQVNNLKSKSNFLNNLRPVGWSAENDRILKFPSQHETVYDNSNLDTSVIEAVVNNLKSIGVNYLTNNVLAFEVGQFCELESESDVNCVWICRIKENIGGRLLLQIPNKIDIKERWFHYLNQNVHCIGWAGSHKFKYLNEINHFQNESHLQLGKTQI
jgi:hypothetical protein